NTVADNAVVKGPIALLGVEGRLAGALEAMLHRKGDRSANDEPVVVTLASVPRDTHLVLVPATPESWRCGQIAMTVPSGRVLIVDPSAQPGRQAVLPDQEVVELVVARREPDFAAKPTKDEPEPSRALTRLMRYRPGLEGEPMLYSLD